MVVSAVDGSGVNANEDFARAGSGLSEVEDFGTAGFCDEACPHAGSRDCGPK